MSESEEIKHTSKLYEWRGDQSSSFCFWCPGCDELHQYTVRKDGNRPAWNFNGNYESPTFTPSLLYPSKSIRCHLFVTEGRIIYCTDCEHSLAGKTVDMVDIPEHPYS